MRGHNTFLERHGDGWRFRVRFPSKLVAFIDRHDLRLRLGRINRREALRRARLMRVDAERLFVELGAAMNVEKAHQAIEEWKRGWLARFATRLVTEGRLLIGEDEMPGEDGHAMDLVARTGIAFDLATLDQRLRRALAGFEAERREFEPIIQTGLVAAGVTDQAPPVLRASMTAAVLKAYAEGQRQLDAIASGDLEAIAAALRPSNDGHSDRSGDVLARPADEQPDTGTGPNRCTAAIVEQSEPPQTALSFEESWKHFVTDKIDVTREWKPSRRPELAGTCRVWTWIIGSKSPSAITKADVAEFRTIFLQLPAAYSRRPDYAETPAADLIHTSQSADRKYERVSVKTFNKHLSTLKGYFSWLKNQGRLAVDVEQMFSGLHVKPKKKGHAGRGERNQYSDDDLKLIFSSPVWVGRHSERRLTAPGDYINRDSLYWGPLLAAFQGARREELAQLCVRHFIQIEGIWVINLNAADLNLKAADGYEDEGSRRLLPLHHNILKLGFLEACVLGRDGDERLFQELNNDNASESFGSALGKRFSNYQKAMKFFPDGVEGGLHRFRHTFMTRLENTDAKTTFVEELTGHESEGRRSERARYTKSIYVQNLKKTIDLLELPIDVDALLASFQRCRDPGAPAITLQPLAAAS